MHAGKKVNSRLGQGVFVMIVLLSTVLSSILVFTPSNVMASRAESCRIEATAMNSPVDPSTAADVAIKVYDTGKNKDSYRITIQDYPADWAITWAGFNPESAASAVTKEINPESAINYDDGHLLLTPPADAQAQSYFIKLYAESMNFGSSSSDMVTVTINVNHIPMVKVSNPAGKSGDPGTFVTYNFVIKNLGNGADRFRIKAEATAEGWSAHSSVSTTPTIASGGTQTITIRHYIPKDARANYTSGLNVYATSITDMSVSDKGRTTTRVNQIYGVDISINPSAMNVLPGNNYEFDIIVNNTGNGEDKNARLELSAWPDEPELSRWKPMLDQSDLKQNGLLYSGSSEATFTITVPESTEEGYYQFSIDAFSGYMGSEWMDSESIELYVLPTVGARVSVDSLNRVKSTAAPGTATYPLILRNSGNTEDTFYLNVSYTTPGLNMKWIYFGDNNITLGAGEEKVISATVVLPQRILAINYTIEFTATSYTDAINGTSTVKTYLHIKPVYDVSISIPEANRTVTVNPSAAEHTERKRSFEFEITNTGNDPENQDQFEVHVEGTFEGWDKWSVTYAERLEPAPFESKPLKLTVTVVKGWPIGDYEFKITVHSLLDPTKVATSSVLVKVVQYDFAVSPDVKYDQKTWSRYVTPVGKEISVTLNIENLGNAEVGKGNAIKSVEVIAKVGSIVVYQGNITHMNPFETKEITFSWTPSSVGEFEINVTVDPNHRIAETREDNNVITTPPIQVTRSTISANKESHFNIGAETWIMLVIIFLEVFLTWYLYILNQKMLYKKKVSDKVYANEQGDQEGEEENDLRAEVIEETPTHSPVPKKQFSPYGSGESPVYQGGGYAQAAAVAPVRPTAPAVSQAPPPRAIAPAVKKQYGLPPMPPARQQPPNRHPGQPPVARPTISVHRHNNPVSKNASHQETSLTEVLTSAKATIKQNEKPKTLMDAVKTSTPTQTQKKKDEKDLKSLLNDIKNS